MSETLDGTARVLLAIPNLNPPAGACGVGAWMLQALCDAPDLDPTLLTWGAVDLERVDEYWGTRLRAGRFERLRARRWVTAPVDRSPVALFLLRDHLMMRETRRYAGSYDVVITGYNEVDLGQPAIQFVQFPWAYHPRPDVDPRWYSLPWRRALLRAYYRACRVASGYREQGMLGNLTLVNSEWTAALFRAAHPTAPEPVVVHPPAAGEFRGVPWEEREPGFVCISRLSPEKELDRVVRILESLNARGRRLRLHLVVSLDSAHRDYGEALLRRLTRHDWVRVHLHLPRTELTRLIESQRYGIHGMREEHFGMAVAELVLGGCAVWVPNGGGQVEIVGKDPALLYESDRDAVAKIERLLDDPAHCAAVRERLRVHRPKLTTDAFTRKIRLLCRRRAGANPMPPRREAPPGAPAAGDAPP